jgi:hypothetical protein
VDNRDRRRVLRLKLSEPDSLGEDRIDEPLPADLAGRTRAVLAEPTWLICCGIADRISAVDAHSSGPTVSFLESARGFKSNRRYLTIGSDLIDCCYRVDRSLGDSEHQARLNFGQPKIDCVESEIYFVSDLI